MAISTHSRAKAAGQVGRQILTTHLFQLTAARRRLAVMRKSHKTKPPFQLTAARRRLVPPLKPLTRKACIALFR